MHPEFKWFLLLLAGLWLAWFVTGGPDRIQTNRANPFMEESTIDHTGDIYGPSDLKAGTRP